MIPAKQRPVAGYGVQRCRELLIGRVLIHMNEGMRWSDAEIVLAIWPTDDRYCSEGERPPELFGDVIRARLRFEGEIKLGFREVFCLTRRLAMALAFSLSFGVVRREFVGMNAPAECCDWIVLPKRTEFRQTLPRATIGDEPKYINHNRCGGLVCALP